jgi:NAD(P)-dependent dehydrogenase (short-subunit alcohol dehydrogenase family)
MPWPGDLSDPAAPAVLIATAASALGGRLDILFANHTLSGSDGTVSTVNSGPGDRDYLASEAYEAVAADFPAGRWVMPDDPARLIAWLATDETGRITGEVVKSDERSRR